jgi:hypothetical protein
MKEELRGVCPARFTSLFAKGGDMTVDKKKDKKANKDGQEVKKVDDEQLKDVTGAKGSEIKLRYGGGGDCNDQVKSINPGIL